MEGILNFVKENPGLVFMALGIIGFIWAITGGGLKTKWGGLPVIAESSRKYVWIISSLIFALGVTFYFVKLNKEIKHDPPPIVTISEGDDSFTDPKDKQVPPPLPLEKHTLNGVLADIFGNNFQEEPVTIENKNGVEIDNTVTDDNGIFELDNLARDTQYTIKYLNSKKTIKFKPEKYDTTNAKLLFTPYDSIKVTLCRDFIWAEGKREPIKPYNNEIDKIIIRADSLPVDSPEKLPVIGCFVQLWGDPDYVKSKNENTSTKVRKDLDIYLYWYHGDSLQKYNHHLGANMNKLSHGWRTRGTKNVWKGNWRVEAKTETGFLIDEKFFEIN